MSKNYLNAPDTESFRITVRIIIYQIILNILNYQIVLNSKTTKLSTIFINYQFTLKFYEITELPLPVNDDRTLVSDDGKLRYDSLDLSESNVGGDLPCPATVADRAPQTVRFPVVIHTQNRGFKWLGWCDFSPDLEFST